MRISERVRRHLAATTRFGDIHVFGEVDSTNRWVRDAATAGAAEGLVAVADHQTAGRGRLGRSWETPPGAGLAASVLLRPLDLDPDRLHLVTAALGLAALAASRGLTGVAAELKWPNDLLVRERKLAGVLAEAIAPGPGAGRGRHGAVTSAGWAVVAGIGLNVASAPAGGAALADGPGPAPERDEVLAALLGELEVRYGRWDAVAAEYRARCATLGRRVRVEGVGGTWRAATATDLDDAGRLVVTFDAAGGRPASTVALDAADVTHLRTT